MALLLAVALDLFHSKIVGVNLFKYRCEISNSGSFLMRQRELLFKCEEKKKTMGEKGRNQHLSHPFGKPCFCEVG